MISPLLSYQSAVKNQCHPSLNAVYQTVGTKTGYILPSDNIFWKISGFIFEQKYKNTEKDSKKPPYSNQYSGL
jgi:hypothetical protein